MINHFTLVWILLTVMAYMIAHRLHKILPYTWCSPVFVCPALLILLLVHTHTTYEIYQEGTKWMTFFLGPIQLAMIIPLYKYASILKKNVFSILLGVMVGTCSGILVVTMASLAFHFSPSTMASLAPKSVTAPMAITVAKSLGGMPELAAIFTFLTALIGMVIGPPILNGMGIRNKMVKGLALGTAASMVGAARAAQMGELEGVMGILGMALSAIMMPILAPEILHFLH